MKIPVRKVMPWQEDASWKVMGSKPGANKDFFLVKCLLKCSCCGLYPLNITSLHLTSGINFQLFNFGCRLSEHFQWLNEETNIL